MPLYEYKCHSCGKTLEVLQKFSDEPLTRHEDCGGELERLISTSALQFKGTGWYVTDYAKGKSPNGSTHSHHKSDSQSSTGGTESSGSSSSSGETKSETKTETKPVSKD